MGEVHQMQADYRKFGFLKIEITRVIGCTSEFAIRVTFQSDMIVVRHPFFSPNGVSHIYDNESLLAIIVMFIINEE